MNTVSAVNTNHGLSRNDFVALGAGAGSADAIAVLRSGQVSKHTVMVLTILDLASRACSEATTMLEDAYELLVSAQTAAPAAVESILAHPSVGSWAERCLRRLRGTLHDETTPLTVELGQLATIAAVAAIHARLGFAVTVPARHGKIFLPTLGLATVDGDQPWRLTVVESDGARITISAADARPSQTTVAVPADAAHDGPGWLGLRRLHAKAAGLAVTVELDDLDPGRDRQNQDREDQELAARMNNEDVAIWQRMLEVAWNELVYHHQDQAEAIAAGLVSLVPLAEPSHPMHGKSITARNAFGRVILTPPRDGITFGATLVHEFHHSKLNAVMDLVPLHDGGTERIYYAPWREDPRPLEGLLHGAYAFIGVTNYWHAQRHALDGPRRDYAEFEFALWRWQVARAAQVLLTSGKLTSFGVDFVQCMARTADTWRSVPVPDEVQRFADVCAQEHETRWRLRNLVPDGAAIAAMALAWQRGEACPCAISKVTVSVVPQPQEPSQRGSLVRMRLARPGEFEMVCDDPSRLAATGLKVTSADIAFACGDLAAAYDQYVADVAADPKQVESFAGLVVAAWAERTDAAGAWLAEAPERIWAIYRRIVTDGRRAPDVDALIEWLVAGDTCGEGTPSDEHARVGQAAVR